MSKDASKQLHAFLRKASEESDDENYSYSLHHMLESQSPDKFIRPVKELLESGADAKYAGRGSETIGYWAGVCLRFSVPGAVEVCELLLENGANIADVIRGSGGADEVKSLRKYIDKNKYGDLEIFKYLLSDPEAYAQEIVEAIDFDVPLKKKLRSSKCDPCMLLIDSLVGYKSVIINDKKSSKKNKSIHSALVRIIDALYRNNFIAHDKKPYYFIMSIAAWCYQPDVELEFILDIAMRFYEPWILKENIEEYDYNDTVIGFIINRTRHLDNNEIEIFSEVLKKMLVEGSFESEFLKAIESSYVFQYGNNTPYIIGRTQNLSKILDVYLEAGGGLTEKFLTRLGGTRYPKKKLVKYAKILNRGSNVECAYSAYLADGLEALKNIGVKNITAQSKAEIERRATLTGDGQTLMFLRTPKKRQIELIDYELLSAGMNEGRGALLHGYKKSSINIIAKLATLAAEDSLVHVIKTASRTPIAQHAASLLVELSGKSTKHETSRYLEERENIKKSISSKTKMFEDKVERLFQELRNRGVFGTMIDGSGWSPGDHGWEIAQGNMWEAIGHGIWDAEDSGMCWTDIKYYKNQLKIHGVQSKPVTSCCIYYIHETEADGLDMASNIAATAKQMSFSVSWDGTTNEAVCVSV